MRRSWQAAAIAMFTAALLALGGALIPTVAVASESSQDVMWGVNTGGDSNPPRDNFTLTAEPGETLADSMLVSNRGTAPLTLSIYAADGFTTESGQLDVLKADETSVGVGAWVRLDEPALVLDPQETVEVPFTLTVPDDTEPGDYAGALVTSLTSAGSGGFSVDRRLGVRIYLQVAGTLTPSVTIDNAQVVYDGTVNPVGRGTASVTFEVTNTGNARLSASHHVSVSGPGGLLATAVVTDELPELLPGESWTAQVLVDDVAPTFAVTADINVSPTLPDGTELDSVAATSSTVAIPWTLLGILVVLIGLLVWWIVHRARIRKSARSSSADESGGDEANDAQDTVARAETADVLAEPVGSAPPPTN